MSTKIYDAYRVPKSVDILSLLLRMKQIAVETIAADKEGLKLAHHLSIALAKKSLSKNPDDLHAKEAVEEYNKSHFAFSSLYWIQKSMKDAHSANEQRLMNHHFNVSIGYDEEYWYLKFFVNWLGYNTPFMKAIEKACPELQDFHYQNQSDAPADVPHEEYEARDKKWDELTAPDGDYRNMMRYTIFDDEEFVRLVRRHWWKGETDLYKHLAYKFDDFSEYHL